jgi:hypothetical protein
MVPLTLRGLSLSIIWLSLHLYQFSPSDFWRPRLPG